MWLPGWGFPGTNEEQSHGLPMAATQVISVMEPSPALPCSSAPCREAWVGLWYVHKVHSLTLKLCLWVAFYRGHQEAALHSSATLNMPDPHIGSVFINIANSAEVGTRGFNRKRKRTDPRLPGSGTDFHNHLESAEWMFPSFLVLWAISSDSCANHCNVNGWRLFQTLLQSSPLSRPCAVHYHEISEIKCHKAYIRESDILEPALHP